MQMMRTNAGLITNALHNSHALFIEIAENAAVLFSEITAMHPPSENTNRRKQPPPVRSSNNNCSSAIWFPRWIPHNTKRALPVNAPVNRVW